MQFAIRITLSAISPNPGYTGGPFIGGIMKMGTANPAIFAWPTERIVECGSFGERIDIATGGNYSQLLDFPLSVSNHDKWYADFETSGASLVGSLVEIGEAISDDDLYQRWSGIVADANFQGINIELRVENILASRHKMIPSRILTTQEFPTLRSEYAGNVVPIIYGPAIRTTPSSLLSVQNTRKAITICNSDGDNSTEDRINTWAAIGSSVPLIGIKFCPVVSVINNSGYVLGGYSEAHWLTDFYAGKTVYLSIVSGTGSGQTRKIESVPSGGLFYSYTEEWISNVQISNVVDSVFNWVGCSIAAPFDTLPDATSIISFFVQETGAVLAAADEGVVSKVYSVKDDIDYMLAFTPSAPAVGIVGADISSEFKNGEDYAALDYEKPSEVYGIAALSDGLTESSGHTVAYMKMAGNTYGDALCRGKLFLDSVPSEVIDSDPDIYLLVSMDAISPTADLWVQFIGQKYDNTQDVIFQSTSALIGIGEPSVNCYSPAILPDGISGAFSAYAIKLPSLPVALERYRSFRFGIMVRDSPLTPTPSIYGPSTWTNSETSVVYSTSIADTLGDPQVGDWIRPDDQVSPRVTSQYYCERFFFGSSHIASPQDWRQITNVTTLAFHRWQLDFVDPITCPTDNYIGILVPNESIVTATEYECGIAFAHSSIPKDDTFLVDFSSGRTYSPIWPMLPSGRTVVDPIILARDSVLDLYYRDLGLDASAVDFASFQALPPIPITSALVERVDSAERVASLCRQFNWCIGHDSLGRETATAWLSRVGSTEYDYSIDTGDIVEGALTGIAISDVIDLVNNPNMKWDFTQANGYRQESNALDVAMDPLLLNSSNYLQYITGFGDFSTALDVYQSLHKSFQINNRQNSMAFELPDVGNDASGVLWPSIGMSRFDWIASRKPIFQLSVPDTSTAAFPTVGKRIKLKHKRYAPNWVYGTIVEFSINPMTAETSITIMGDPTQLASGDNELYIDTIDPIGAVEMYTDMVDGTSEQYTDNIAGA